MREKYTRPHSYADNPYNDANYRKAMDDTEEAHQEFLAGKITGDECAKRYIEIFDRYTSEVMAGFRRKTLEELSRE